MNPLGRQPPPPSQLVFPRCFTFFSVSSPPPFAPTQFSTPRMAYSVPLITLRPTEPKFPYCFGSRTRGFFVPTTELCSPVEATCHGHFFFFDSSDHLPDKEQGHPFFGSKLLPYSWFCPLLRRPTETVSLSTQSFVWGERSSFRAGSLLPPLGARITAPSFSRSTPPN